MNAVAIENVTKTFGRFTAVDDLSLAVPAGTIYGFIGPNGSGKTTTLRMVTRILLPDAGHIRVLGAETWEAASDRVAYLPEERGLYKKMTVSDVLRFYAELKGFRDCKPAIAAWLERMGLGGQAGRGPVQGHVAEGAVHRPGPLQTGAGRPAEGVRLPAAGRGDRPYPRGHRPPFRRAAVLPDQGLPPLRDACREGGGVGVLRRCQRRGDANQGA
jgi:ABC-type sugar transport system ATPase subunit